MEFNDFQTFQEMFEESYAGDLGKNTMNIVGEGIKTSVRNSHVSGERVWRTILIHGCRSRTLNIHQMSSKCFILNIFMVFFNILKL